MCQTADPPLTIRRELVERCRGIHAEEQGIRILLAREIWANH
jgi:hypothetical protein